MNKDEVIALRKSLGIKVVKIHSGAWSESQHQAALFRWAALATNTRPELRFLYAVPNGGYRTAATAGRLRGEGVKAGVFDVSLDVARHGFHGLRLELKRPRTEGVKGAYKTVPAGKPSLEQLVWQGNYRAEGYKAEFCEGWLHAKSIIEEYLDDR